MRHLAWAVILISAFSLANSAAGVWQGTWAATVTSGASFAGTWSAAPGKAPDTVAGTWSLRDQNGSELASGSWAAGKEGKLWKGTWQARGTSGQVYEGSWRSEIELPASAHFAELFDAAILKAVNGTWRAGDRVGAWSIRAFSQQ